MNFLTLIERKFSRSISLHHTEITGKQTFLIDTILRTIANHKFKLINFSAFIISCWIILPSIPYSKQSRVKRMFSKRPDKNTTGLINMRNDCFANSSVQAYSSLPGLTEYLNKMLDAYLQSIDLVNKYGIDLNDISPTDSILNLSYSKFTNKDPKAMKKSVLDSYKIPLHVALAKIIKKLQETQMTTRTVSVWTFLHEIERIYNAKISRSQHDAHELTQLINETLETENLICIKVFKSLKEYLSSKDMYVHGIEGIEFPEFPFGGLALSQMKCLTCSYVSKPNITPFLMLTLHPPQEVSSDLEKLLDENESETITEYHCLKCRILKIVDNEKLFREQGKRNEPAEEEFISKLVELNGDEHLFINEDLSPDLEKYLKDYNKCGLESLRITSTVYRQTHILKPPKVFGIHLSRSTFDGVAVTRNPCRVSFSDKLSLSIDESYLEDLQKFQQGALDEPIHEKSSTRLLTTDVDDMEDENVQREDVDEKGEDGDDSENSSDGDGLDVENTDSDSLSSVDSSPSLITASKADTLNSAPISEDQTKSLMKHFSKFKFNENNVYKYRLKAVIKHQGSHTQGHYECYKRKPLFVRDTDGNYLKLSPEIDEELLSKVDGLSDNSEKSDPKSRTSSTSTANLQDTIEGDRGKIREKFSMMMGRRPSIFQADPTEANLQEIIDSGLATPAEVFVEGGDYFQAPSAQDFQKLFHKFAQNNAHSTSSKIKMKKIPSVIKFPYWRIGDAQVSEVSKSAVMFETSSAYMLYFERLDRKQIKRY